MPPTEPLPPEAPARRADPDGPTVPPAAASPEEPPPPADPELVAEFLSETRSLLDDADQRLLSLDKGEGDSSAVDTVFRCLHTIKGVSGFMGLEPIRRVAHLAEDLLHGVRDRHELPERGRIDQLLAAVDALRALADHVELDPTDASTLQEMAAPCVERLQAYSREEPLDEVGAPGASRGARATAARAPQPDARTEDVLRVRADRLDQLVDTVGELVVVASMVERRAAEGGDAALREHVARLGRIARNLQEQGTSMRMVPIRGLFQRLERVVRDLARQTGKDVATVISGESVELDKRVVDHLGDALVHVVRNAVDHGVEEDAAARTVAGKPARASVRLEAAHRGGCIVLTVSDDGRGLDRAAILKRAYAKGLVGEGPPPDDAERFIFEPGFSTARRVTDLSGRGVGLDVVKRAVESMRGTIDLRSEPGRGTCFTFVLPLTLAIIDGLSVRVGSELYILPSLSVLRLHRPLRPQIATVADRGEAFVERGEFRPIVRLARILGVTGAEEDVTRGILVVAQAADQRAALLVDEVRGQQQVVIKGIGPAVGHLPGIAGSAILPDGTVGLILDVGDLVRLANAGVATVSAALRRSDPPYERAA